MLNIMYPTSDISVKPGAPRNVAFDILSHTDDTRPDLILQARWAVQDCGRDFGCVEVLGYIIMCQEKKNSMNSLRKIVWQFEVAELSLGTANLSILPVTAYQCFMASFNGNGIGFYGSRVDIAGVEQGMELLLFACCSIETQKALSEEFSHLKGMTKPIQ